MKPISTMILAALLAAGGQAVAAGPKSPSRSPRPASGADGPGPGSAQHRWFLMEYPPLWHPILSDARINIIAVVLKDAVNFSKPIGYPDYPDNSPIYLAKRTADHLQFQQYFRGGPRDNGHGYGGAAMLLNWGWGADYLLQTNPADGLGTWGGCRDYTLYNAVGCLDAPGTLRRVTTEYIDALKVECDQRGLTYPEVFIHDFENRATVEYSFMNADVIPFDYDGSWPGSVASPRYNTEVLVTLGGDKTLADLVAGQPPLPRNDHDYFFSYDINQAWSEQVYCPIEERVHDDAMYRVFGQHFSQVFPGAVWGNYALQLVLDPAHQYRDQNNSWMSWYQQDPSVRLRATLQAPVCYGPRMTGGASYDPALIPELGLGTTRQEIWRNFAVDQVHACVASASFLPMLPHIELPNTVSANVIGQYVPTISDVAYILSEQAFLGAHQWLVFNPNMTAEHADDLLEAIHEFDRIICYANCDHSSNTPVLNVLDFSCFLNKFAAADAYANCDGSTGTPLLNVLDFACFVNKFAAGCP